MHKFVYKPYGGDTPPTFDMKNAGVGKEWVVSPTDSKVSISDDGKLKIEDHVLPVNIVQQEQEPIAIEETETSCDCVENCGCEK